MLTAVVIAAIAVLVVSSHTVTLAGKVRRGCASHAPTRTDVREQEQGHNEQRAESALRLAGVVSGEDHVEIIGRKWSRSQGARKNVVRLLSDVRFAIRNVVRVATTLATRTAPIYIRSCPEVSAQNRSPRGHNSRVGFVIRAVRNGLREPGRFRRYLHSCDEETAALTVWATGPRTAH